MIGKKYKWSLCLAFVYCGIYVALSTCHYPKIDFKSLKTLHLNNLDLNTISLAWPSILGRSSSNYVYEIQSLYYILSIVLVLHLLNSCRIKIILSRKFC